MSGLTLDAFKPRVVEVDILDGEAVRMTVSLAALTWAEYHEIGMSVPEPTAPRKRGVQNGKIAEVADTNDAEYLQALNDVILERRRRRLVRSLIRAGNLPELASSTIEEQAAALEQFDVAVVACLYRAMDALINNAKERLHSAADTFQRGRGVGAADMPGERVELEPVASASGR